MPHKICTRRKVIPLPCPIFRNRTPNSSIHIKSKPSSQKSYKIKPPIHNICFRNWKTKYFTKSKKPNSKFKDKYNDKTKSIWSSKDNWKPEAYWRIKFNPNYKSQKIKKTISKKNGLKIESTKENSKINFFRKENKEFLKISLRKDSKGSSKSKPKMIQSFKRLSNKLQRSKERLY